MLALPIPSRLSISEAPKPSAFSFSTEAASTGLGRPRPVDAASVEKLKAEGLGASEIDKRLGIGRASIYRALSTLSVK